MKLWENGGAVSHARSGEPRGYTRWLCVVGALASSLAVNVVQFVIVFKGGVHP